MNKIKYLLTIIIVGIAMFAMFYLIFSGITSQMVWCTISAIIFSGGLFSNMFTVKSTKSLTVRNSSINIILYLVSGTFFVWTLIYVFLSDDWLNPERSLKTLYIGYLIILAVGVILFFATDTGSNVAQEENEKVQSQIMAKQLLINKIDKIISISHCHRLTNNRETDKMLDNLRSVLQSIPSSTFINSETSSRISLILSKLEALISSEDDINLKEAIKKDINNIKNII